MNPHKTFIAACVVAFCAFGGLRVAFGQNSVYNYFSQTAEAQGALVSVERNHLHKGIANLRNGTPTELYYAKNEFDFILGYFPNHPRVLVLLADTLVKLGQSSQIDGYFDRALAISPNEALLHVAYGVTLLRQDRVDDAIKSLQRGVELNENSVNGHYNLGLALVRAKRFDEANRHAQLAYALGHPLPGLREQLRRAGAWKPDKPEAKKSKASAEKTPG